jgi:hypothetical protein
MMAESALSEILKNTPLWVKAAVGVCAAAAIFNGLHDAGYSVGAFIRSP